MYLFRGPTGEVLYVGTATDLRRRVGQYFNGADPRGRMKEMVGLAAAVDHVECAHPLEAGVRELRLLAAHAPPYNRRSRFPHRWWWVVLTDEAFPRLSVVREPRHDRAIGPFRSRADAADTAELVARFTGVRTCTARVGRAARARPGLPRARGRALPRAARGLRRASTPPPRSGPRHSSRGSTTPPWRPRCSGWANWPGDRATRAPPGCATRPPQAVDVLWRGQRLRALAAVEELVAAAPDGAGGWQLVVVRHGQLAAAGTARRGVPPMPVVDALRAGAQVILPQSAPLGGALVEETALIARWLAAPGVRIVSATTGFASTIGSAGPWSSWAATARSARLAAEQAQRLDSELLREPHPTREELLGRPGVDGFGGPAQPLLPGRQPFGVAG